MQLKHRGVIGDAGGCDIEIGASCDGCNINVIRVWALVGLENGRDHCLVFRYLR